MVYKIPYREYGQSKTATNFSRAFSHFSFYFLILFIIFSFISWPFVFVLIPYICLCANIKKIEQKIAKKFPNIPGYDIPVRVPTEQEYEQAKKILELGIKHPAVKEIAKIKKVPKKEVILHYEAIIRDYNLSK